MELLEKKQAIRAEILSRRDGLAAADRQKDSHAIAERILSLPAFDDTRIIHLYLSVRNEVETAEILQRGLAL